MVRWDYERLMTFICLMIIAIIVGGVIGIMFAGWLWSRP